MRGLVIGDTIQRHGFYHLAAALIGLHFGQQIIFAVEHADAGRPVELVAGHDVKIGIEFADIDLCMYCALRAVDEHGDATGMGDLDDPLDRIHRAQNVGHMGNRNDTRAIGERGFESVDVQRAFVRDVNELEHCALALAVQMPGHDIGMVFHDRGDDLVPCPDARTGKG
ncbi:hypothetical protein D3C71_1575180 [compost metagenome]